MNMRLWLCLLILHLTVAENAFGQLYWNTNGAQANWASGNWSTNPSGPFNITWTNNTNAIFNANSTVNWVAGTQIGNISVASGVTVTLVPAGVLSTNGNVRTINVGSGALLDFSGQAFATASGTGFVKNGAGTWIIGMQGNNYSGGFTLNAGTVVVAGSNSLGSATGTLTLNGGAISSSGNLLHRSAVVFGGNVEHVGTGNQEFNGAVNLGAVTRIITNNAAGGNRIYSGVISGSPGVGLTIAGAGVTTLSGANTYSGSTTVSAGVLNITNATGSGTGTGNVTVSGGILTGNGIISGATTVQTGGTLEAGNGAFGTLTINSAVNFQSGGTLRSQAGVGAGTSDTINVSGSGGSLTLASGSNLTILGDGTSYSGLPSYTLANLGSNSLTFGTFNGGVGDIATYTANGTYSTNGVNVTISGFTFNSGDQLTLRRTPNTLELTFTPVPEPAFVLGAFLLPGGVVAGLRTLLRRAKPAEFTPAA